METVTFVIGFIIGVISVALAFELGMKRSNRSEPASRSTKTWSISELQNPRIVAEYLGDIDIPKNSKLLVNQFKDKNTLEGIEAKHHKGIKGNFILGDDRALILAGPMKNDELGFWTVEKEILEKLNDYFEESWSKGSTMKQEEKP